MATKSKDTTPTPHAKNPNPSTFRSMTVTFDGTKSQTIVECRDFIRRFEEYRSLEQWSDAAAVNAFSLCLKGTASMWMYSFLDDNTSIKDGVKILPDWEKVKRAFIKKFDRASTPKDKVAQILNLTQGKDETVKMFAVRVDYTIRVLNAENSNLENIKPENRNAFKMGLDAAKQNQMITYFCNGLLPHLQSKVLAHADCNSFDALVDKATQLEMSEEKQQIALNEL